MDFTAFERDGLVTAAALRDAGEDGRVLRDAWARGELERVRRGAYCIHERWVRCSDRERHLLEARAVLLARPSAVLVGRTAAAAWRLPHAAQWPSPVTILVPGAVGASRGGVRVLSMGASRVSTVNLDGMRCSTIARTAADVARRSDFETAVAVLDAARSRKHGSRVSLNDLTVELDAARRGRERLTATLARALEFSTELAESVGESITRVAIQRAGFTAPTLQQKFVDADGSMTVDFWWPDAGVAVEFDGKVKYTRQEFTRGDPSDVVWREKRREDRLRRLVTRVDRLVFADVRSPERLHRILSDAGVPARGGVVRARTS